MMQNTDGCVTLIYDPNSNMRNVIVDNKSGAIITSQFDNILENEKALDYLNENKHQIQNFEYYNYYHGTIILVFYIYEKWYITTRKCLNANLSYWDNDKSHGELFTDLFNSLSSFDHLNTNYCYHFLLCPNDLYLLMITEKFNHNRIYESIPNVKNNIPLEYSSPQDAIANNNNGLIIRNGFTVCKFVNNSNSNNNTPFIYSKLDELGSFVFNLYKLTRKNRLDNYDQMPGIYKSILYDIHGIYLKTKNTTSLESCIDFLKTLEPKKLVNLYNTYKFS